jgi:hypothetical protein
MIEAAGAPELAQSLKLRLEEVAVARQQASDHASHSGGAKPLLPAMAFQCSAVRR